MFQKNLKNNKQKKNKNLGKLKNDNWRRKDNKKDFEKKI